MKPPFATIAALLALLWVTPADAWLAQAPAGVAPANYYFAAAGSDSNNCLTTGTACQTISHLNGLTYASGATIHLNGGDTFSSTAIALTATNAPSGNVEVTSYGTGQPIISSGNSAACVTATNIPSVTVNNLACTGGGNLSNTTPGISVVNSQSGNTTLAGPTISNNTVSGYGANGIEVKGTNGTSGFNGITISGNVVHDDTGNYSTDHTSCIFVFSAVGAGYGHNNVHSNLTLSGNTTYNCTGTTAASVWSGSAITVAETNTATIESNIAHDFGANAALGSVGIWAFDATNITIEFNEAYNAFRTGSVDGDGFDLDGGVTNSLVQYNWAHNNVGWGLLAFGYNDGTVTTWDNNTFRFNIAQNNGGDIAIGGSSAMTGANVYNNTAVALAGESAMTCQNTSTMTGNVANNILFGQAAVNLVACPSPSSIALNGNDYYGSAKFSWNGTSYTTFASWKSGATQETVNGGFNSNPEVYVPGGGFITAGYSPAKMMAYNLQSGSPMLPNAGINLTTQFSITPGTQDFYGNAVTASTLPVGAASADFATFAASCTAATNFLARVSSFAKLDNVNYNSLLCGLNSDASLAHLDGLYILAAPNSAASLLNLVSTSYSLTSHGTLTFSAGHGTTGNGSTGYFDTGFTPSTAGGNLTLNSTVFGGYDVSARSTGSAKALGGVANVANTTNLDVFPETGGVDYGEGNDATGTFTSATSAQELLVIDRPNATTEALYKNGSILGSPASVNSVALEDQSLVLFAFKEHTGTVDQFSPDELTAAFFGDATPSRSGMAQRLNAFMTALGINVF